MIAKRFQPAASRCFAHDFYFKNIASFACLVLSILLTPFLAAQELVLNYGVTSEGHLVLAAPEDASSYYVLEESSDLENFRATLVALGSPAPLWRQEAPLIGSHRFLRLKAVNLFEPVDSDQEGLDDFF